MGGFRGAGWLRSQLHIKQIEMKNTVGGRGLVGATETPGARGGESLSKLRCLHSAAATHHNASATGREGKKTEGGKGSKIGKGKNPRPGKWVRATKKDDF